MEQENPADVAWSSGNKIACSKIIFKLWLSWCYMDFILSLQNGTYYLSRSKTVVILSLNLLNLSNFPYGIFVI